MIYRILLLTVTALAVFTVVHGQGRQAPAPAAPFFGELGVRPAHPLPPQPRAPSPVTTDKFPCNP